MSCCREGDAPPAAAGNETTGGGWIPDIPAPPAGGGGFDWESIVGGGKPPTGPPGQPGPPGAGPEPPPGEWHTGDNWGADGDQTPFPTDVITRRIRCPIGRDTSRAYVQLNKPLKDGHRANVWANVGHHPSHSGPEPSGKLPRPLNAHPVSDRTFRVDLTGGGGTTVGPKYQQKPGWGQPGQTEPVPPGPYEPYVEVLLMIPKGQTETGPGGPGGGWGAQE